MEKFWIESCPKNYRPIGRYLCDFKCPDNKYEDTRDACIPKIFTNHEYFSSSLVDNFGIKSEYM